ALAGGGGGSHGSRLQAHGVIGVGKAFVVVGGPEGAGVLVGAGGRARGGEPLVIAQDLGADRRFLVGPADRPLAAGGPRGLRGTRGRDPMWTQPGGAGPVE